MKALAVAARIVGFLVCLLAAGLAHLFVDPISTHGSAVLRTATAAVVRVEPGSYTLVFDLDTGAADPTEDDWPAVSCQVTEADGTAVALQPNVQYLGERGLQGLFGRYGFHRQFATFTTTQANPTIGCSGYDIPSEVELHPGTLLPLLRIGRGALIGSILLFGVGILLIGKRRPWARWVLVAAGAGALAAAVTMMAGSSTLRVSPEVQKGALPEGVPPEASLSSPEPVADTLRFGRSYLTSDGCFAFSLSAPREYLPTRAVVQESEPGPQERAFLVRFDFQATSAECGERWSIRETRVTTAAGVSGGPSYETIGQPTAADPHQVISIDDLNDAWLPMGYPDEFPQTQYYGFFTPNPAGLTLRARLSHEDPVSGQNTEQTITVVE
ncbi:MAG: hypothetical protein QM804_07800 [Propionicimonas sp.]